MTVELWWHALTMECDCGITSTLIACASTEHPEELVARLQGPDRQLLLLACQFGCQKFGLLRYVRSWNHEPSDEEKELVGL